VARGPLWGGPQWFAALFSTRGRQVRSCNSLPDVATVTKLSEAALLIAEEGPHPTGDVRKTGSPLAISQ
jgi:hypothetical protein